VRRSLQRKRRLVAAKSCQLFLESVATTRMPSLGVSSLDLGRQPRSRPLLYAREAMTRSKAAPNRDLTGTRRRALEMLAGSPHGCTEAFLQAHGFGVMIVSSADTAGARNNGAGDNTDRRKDAD
jgi:hypothetical protein